MVGTQPGPPRQLQRLQPGESARMRSWGHPTSTDVDLRRWGVDIHALAFTVRQPLQAFFDHLSLAKLHEANGIGILAEAAAANVKAVLANQATRCGADSAEPVPFRVVLWVSVPRVRHLCVRERTACGEEGRMHQRAGSAML